MRGMLRVWTIDLRVFWPVEVMPELMHQQCKGARVLEGG